MVLTDFQFAQSPHVIFGAGKFKQCATETKRFGSKALVVTGRSSLAQSGHWQAFLDQCKTVSIEVTSITISNEPTPEDIDKAVKSYHSKSFDVVVAIGGGSVIDMGKALSAMLPLGEPILPYLEGIGDGRKHPGTKIPFIAVPTTAGTGTEATKNASIRQIGENGFKNSLRHDNFIPNLALIDPELSLHCPKALSATCGLDAFAQLLESFVSPKASPITDALAYSGLAALKDSLLQVCSTEADLESRTQMAYAAFVSGLTLANAGLGVVHGLSSIIGGYIAIPHGIICGRLIGPGTQMNIEKMLRHQKDNVRGLTKHAKAATILTGSFYKDSREACNALVQLINQWVDNLNIPLLGTLGLTHNLLDKILAKSSNRNNPVLLDKDDMRWILERSI